MNNNISDKYTFVFDNKTNVWFVIDTKSDKYKFYARVKKDNIVREKEEKKSQIF